MAKKQRPFKTEAREADWWANNQNLIADRFELAKATGKLGKGTVARVARERASFMGGSPPFSGRQFRIKSPLQKTGLNGMLSA